MDFEKKVFIVLGVIVGLIFILSISGSFTGFAVQDYDKTVNFNEAIPGHTIKDSLIVEVAGEGVIKEIVSVNGENADWITFDSTEYVFVPNLENKIPYKISIPEGTPEGEYSFQMAVISVEDFETQSILADQVINQIEVVVEVGEEVMRGFTIKDFDVFSLEEEDNIDFALTVINRGNVEEDMDIKIEIKDLNGNFITSQEFSGKLYAYEMQEIKHGFFEDLEKGDYIADVYVQVGDSMKKQTSSFSVYEENSLTKNANILGTSVYLKNNQVYVTSIVENTGNGVLAVNLEGTVREDSFSSEEKRILPGEFEVFEYSYSVEGAEDYLLRSEVTYGNIVLGEQETPFYVSDEGVVTLEFSFIAILILVVIALVVSHYILNKKLHKKKK